MLVKVETEAIQNTIKQIRKLMSIPEEGSQE